MPDPAPALTLDDQLCFSLYGASLAINRAYKPLLDALEITYPQYLVLSALWEVDGQSVGAIADRLGLDSSNVTPLVKRMEAAGLLSRRRNPTDERQVVVSLDRPRPRHAGPQRVPGPNAFHLGRDERRAAHHS